MTNTDFSKTVENILNARKAEKTRVLAMAPAEFDAYLAKRKSQITPFQLYQMSGSMTSADIIK